MIKIVSILLFFLIFGTLTYQESFAGYSFAGYNYNIRDQILLAELEPWAITCEYSDNHKLVFKNSNHLPACVTYDTAEKLIKRMWAKSNVDYSWYFDKLKQLENSTLSVKYNTLHSETLEQVTSNQDTLRIKINATSGYTGSFSVFIPSEIFDLECVNYTSKYITTSPYMLENYKDGQRIRVKQVPTESLNTILDFKFVSGVHEITIGESIVCKDLYSEYHPIFQYS